MLFALSGMLFTCAGNFFNDSPVQSTILIIVTVCMLGIGIGMYIHLFRCVAYAGVDYAYKEMEEKLRKPYTKADIQSLGLHKFDILSCKRPRAEEENSQPSISGRVSLGRHLRQLPCRANFREDAWTALPST